MEDLLFKKSIHTSNKYLELHGHIFPILFITVWIPWHLSSCDSVSGRNKRGAPVLPISTPDASLLPKTYKSHIFPQIVFALFVELFYIITLVCINLLSWQQGGVEKGVGILRPQFSLCVRINPNSLGGFWSILNAAHK